MGYERSSFMWRINARNQNQYSRLCPSCRCHPSRRWIDHPNCKKTILCLWINSLTKIDGTNFPCRNYHTRWRLRRCLLMFEYKKRSYHRGRISLGDTPFFGKLSYKFMLGRSELTYLWLNLLVLRHISEALLKDKLSHNVFLIIGLSSTVTHLKLAR